MICENEDLNINVISKKFNTNSDFNAYVAQHRGLQILPQEKQAIINYNNVKPSELSDFLVKYETTDDFSNNNTTVIKKLKEGTQYCWTAFSKNEAANSMNATKNEIPKQSQQQSQTQKQPEVNDTVEIIKSVPFNDETVGSKILSEFLIKLDI